MSNIFKNILELLKDLLPFLKDAAEKAFEKLPKEDQERLIATSKLTEVIKLAWKSDNTLTTDEVITIVETQTGLTKEEATSYLLAYLKAKGIEAGSFSEAVRLIWEDADKRVGTGIKSLWAGITNIVSEFVSNINWETLLMGIGEYVYRTYVKGKIKI